MLRFHYFYSMEKALIKKALRKNHPLAAEIGSIKVAMVGKAMSKPVSFVNWNQLQKYNIGDKV